MRDRQAVGLAASTWSSTEMGDDRKEAGCSWLPTAFFTLLTGGPKPVKAGFLFGCPLPPLDLPPPALPPPLLADASTPAQQHKHTSTGTSHAFKGP